MTATEIISEIQRLPQVEKELVVRVANALDTEGMLSGEEIGYLARRLIDSTDPAEEETLRGLIHQGFYGFRPNA